MKKLYHGSCHSGAVRFECELDLAEGTSKCNCSICTMTRFWKAIVKADAFRLFRMRKDGGNRRSATEDYPRRGSAACTT